MNDELIKFIVKARLSILPTKFTTFIWNRENNPHCPFGCLHTESIAHLFNGCISTFSNFYSRRHNRIVEMVREFISEASRNKNVYSERNTETLFPHLDVGDIQHKRPDIHVISETEYMYTC